jgi:ATP-dependent Clp protease ATP-binding subunit ClpA
MGDFIMSGDDNEFFNQSDADLLKSIKASKRTAFENGNSEIYIEHLLINIANLAQCTELFEACGVTVEDVLTNTRGYLDEIKDIDASPDFDKIIMSNICTTIYNRAVLTVSAQSTSRKVGAQNIISSIMAEKNNCWAYDMLSSLGLKRFNVVNWVSNGQSKKDIDKKEPAPALDYDLISSKEDSKSPLEKFGFNLIEHAAAGKIDPLIGRGKEIQRAIQVLSRRRKNNPVFVGDSGVGKSALVEGLATSIHNGSVPEKLKKVQIYSISMSDLVAGCRFRGDFEERMKELVAEVKSRPEVIIFFDEIHTMINAGTGGSGSMDAANILKPALERGEFRCIGATTFQEYRKHFVKDPALSRRFQEVEVDEPSESDTKQIMLGSRDNYVNYHDVEISEEVIDHAIDLSKRYLANRKFPDKVFDILDECGSLYSSGINNNADGTGKNRVTKGDVEAVVSYMSKVPVTDPKDKSANSIKNLERDLRSLIFGQDEAIKSTVRAVKIAKAGLRDEEKPLGSLMFSGPTGVGKTELTKQLSKKLDLELLRFDMSEYQEKHAVARLIGAPPGYVGYGEGGMLTEAVSKKPHCIVLLDEIEKAHPDIYNAFLQVMDYGYLTDGQGRKINFRNVILIMTTNAGASDMAKQSIGFISSGEGASDKENIVLNDTFSPEFRNRLDSVVNFSALEPENMINVVEKEILLLELRLNVQGIFLELDTTARDWLAVKGYDRAMGARPLTRAIKDHVYVPLSEEILGGKLEEGGIAYGTVDNDEDSLVFQFEQVPQVATVNNTGSQSLPS